MVLRKWNRQKRKYEPYIVPSDWRLVLHTDDMSELTDCPHCGQPVPYGDAYTSTEIHTHRGIGYMICEKCFEAEWARELAYRKEQYEQTGSN